MDQIAEKSSLARKSRWKGIGLFIVVLAIVLLVGADLALRIGWGLGSPLLYRSDAAAGYVPAPSQHIVRFRCHNDINQFSMRSPEVISPKPAGEFRLLMIGDSITYGTTYVDQSEIFTTLLNQSLPARLGKKVEVLNASAGGWAPGNELGYLQSRGSFNADMVIMVWNTGDLIQPFSSSSVGSPSFPDKNPSCALGEVLDRYILPRLKHIDTADAGSVAEVPHVVRDTPANLKILGETKSLAIDSGATFAVLYVPFHGPDWAPYAPGLQMLKDWCKAQQVDLVDMTPAFAPIPAEQIAFDGGRGHLRPLGHSIVAKAVADYVADHMREQNKSPTTRRSVALACRPAY